jgi:tRNA A-37 threonylcarbamoyl transferase component Bud32
MNSQNYNVTFYNVITAQFTSYRPQNSIKTLAATVDSGYAYILYNDLDGKIEVDVIKISDLSLQKNFQITNSTAQFITTNAALPLLYYRDELFFEVHYMKTDFDIMIAISLSTYNWRKVEWLPGWISLHKYSNCENYIYGVQQGSLYWINLETNITTPIVWNYCKNNANSQQQTINYAIDMNKKLIYALNLCDIPTLNIYNFTGAPIASVRTFASDCINPIDGFYNIESIDVTGEDCPGVFITEEIDPDRTLFYITVGVVGGVIILIIVIGSFTICILKRPRSGYEEIGEGDESFRNASPTLHDVLSVSGGKIDANEIEIKDLIGQGSFANVYRGKIHETEVAVKVIKVISMKDMEQSLLAEAGIMVKLRHPHIVLFMGACIKTPDLFLVTEYMSNGSVREILDKKDVQIEPEHVRRFALDSTKGMAYLHSRKILHRDLKTHNLLVDGNWNVKVADFGLSRSMIEQDGTMTACGTPSWAAPEVLRRDHYTHKADIYSFGICLWEMTTRQRPYGSLKPYQVVISVATDGLRPDLESYSIPIYFEKIIKQCWSDDPNERPEFTQLRTTMEELRCPMPKSPHPSYKKEIQLHSRSMPNVVDRSHQSGLENNNII